MRSFMPLRAFKGDQSKIRERHINKQQRNGIYLFWGFFLSNNRKIGSNWQRLGGTIRVHRYSVLFAWIYFDDISVWFSNWLHRMCWGTWIDVRHFKFTQKPWFQYLDWRLLTQNANCTGRHLPLTLKVRALDTKDESSALTFVSKCFWCWQLKQKAWHKTKSSVFTVFTLQCRHIGNLCVFFRCSKISSPVQKVRWTNGNNYVEWSRKLAGCIFPKRNFCECTFARCTQLSTPKGTLRVNLNQDICSTKGKPIFLVSEPINRTKLLETHYKDLLQHVPQKPGSSARSG